MSNLRTPSKRPADSSYDDSAVSSWRGDKIQRRVPMESADNHATKPVTQNKRDSP